MWVATLSRYHLFHNTVCMKNEILSIWMNSLSNLCEAYGKKVTYVSLWPWRNKSGEIVYKNNKYNDIRQFATNMWLTTNHLDVRAFDADVQQITWAKAIGSVQKIIENSLLVVFSWSPIRKYKEKIPWIEDAQQMIRKICDSSTPYRWICFSHWLTLLALTWDSSVISSLNKDEMNIWMTKTCVDQTHPLFSDMDDTIVWPYSQVNWWIRMSAYKDWCISGVPVDIISTSEDGQLIQWIQYTWTSAPNFSTQMHPETPDWIRQLMMWRKEYYLKKGIFNEQEFALQLEKIQKLQSTCEIMQKRFTSNLFTVLKTHRDSQ